MNAVASFMLPKDGVYTLGPKSKIIDIEGVRAEARTGAFYVFGLITYKDIFGDDQWVEFCYFLDGKTFLEALAIAEKAPGQKIEISFKTPPFGNDTSFNPDHAEGMKEYRKQQKNNGPS